MKKFLTIITTLILLIIPITSFANTDNNLKIYSPSCILIDADSGKIIYEKNIHEKMYPASTTKIMTAILAIEKCDLKELATVSENSVSEESVPEGYVRSHLVPGESFTIEQLLNVLLIPSANDAAIVLAEHISKSTGEFSNLMNKKAEELGCKNTHFVNPNGVHNNNHYSTVYDMCLIARYAMNNETFRNIVCKTSYTLPPTDKYTEDDREFQTTNDLLFTKTKNGKENPCFYEYATGVKTGFTDEAGYCLVASAKKDNNNYIAVTFGNNEKIDGKSERAVDCTTLFNYAIENYKEKNIFTKNTVVKQVNVELPSRKNEPVQTEPLNILIENTVSVKTTENIENITPKITIQENLKTPILEGTILGTIECEIDGTIYKSNLIAGENIIPTKDISYIFNFLLLLLIIIIVLTILSHFIHNHRKHKKNQNNKNEFWDYKITNF